MVGAAALMLFLLHVSKTTARQSLVQLRSNEGSLREDVVETLYPGVTSGDYHHVPWGKPAMCSPGFYAIAFQLKTDPIFLVGDDSGLTGVKLFCYETKSGRLDRKPITSAVDVFRGLWGVMYMCEAGFLNGVRVQLEQPWNAKRDQTAANNLKMQCEYGDEMTGDGNDRGYWGEWARCPEGSAICGLATQVLTPPFIFKDDVSLISAIFFCCSL